MLSGCYHYTDGVLNTAFYQTYCTGCKIHPKKAYKPVQSVHKTSYLVIIFRAQKGDIFSSIQKLQRQILQIFFNESCHLIFKKNLQDKLPENLYKCNLMHIQNTQFIQTVNNHNV